MKIELVDVHVLEDKHRLDRMAARGNYYLGLIHGMIFALFAWGLFNWLAKVAQ